MNDFGWEMPTHFVFGRDAEEKVGSWLAGHGFKHALVVYGKGHVVSSGLLGRVRDSIESAGVDMTELGGIRPNPEVTDVRKGVELAKGCKADIVIPVGGGSVIDCSKAIAIGALYSGDVWDFFTKDKAVRKEPVDVLPLGVVLTIPASGSEASNACVISNDALGLKSSAHADTIRPKVAFMNPELTMSLPAWQTAAGITDMCAHILERYFSDSGEVPVTDGIALSLLSSARCEALRLMRDPNDYEARANVMWIGTLAHCGLAGIGRHEDWASHGLEHELSALKPGVTHGAGLAVMFPAWMRHVYKANPRRFVRYGATVFGMVPTGDDELDALSAIDLTQDFFVSLGMPRYLDDLGFTPDDVEGMLPTLIINKGEPFGSFMRLTRDDAREIYLSAFRKAD